MILLLLLLLSDITALDLRAQYTHLWFINYFLPRWKLITIPKKYCLDLRREGHLETRPATLYEYPW